MSFPKYERGYIAAEKYAEIARELGLEFGTAEEGAKALAGAVRELMKKMNIPLTLKACGIEEEKFLEKVDYLAIKAFEDQCTTCQSPPAAGQRACRGFIKGHTTENRKKCLGQKTYQSLKVSINPGSFCAGH